ncbi:MAG: aminoacyl-histidine dipeptidase, partial [Rikenellaceae bacterium]
MSENLNLLKPEKVWKHFMALCNIPHISKHESALAAYIVDFAKKNNIECHTDKIGNVLLRKPASKGMEGCKGIIMQGHIDMVAQKNNDKKFDFLKDGIEPIIDGEWVTADGTTLGADNGIGVSSALAIMESNDLVHGDIEALFTIDEETGMTGAFALANNLLKGDILLNLDSESEGELYVGCAGGVDVVSSLPIVWQKVENGYTTFSLNLGGMKGGHSGMEIILQRGNANKALARVIYECMQVADLRVISFNGGDVRNAIPRESSANVVVKDSDVACFEKKAKEIIGAIKNELKERESTIELQVSKIAAADKSFDKHTSSTFINLVNVHPNGVVRMSDTIPGLVETSNNLGVIKTEENKITSISLVRSSSNTYKDYLRSQICGLFENAGGESLLFGDYNGWTPNMNSPILNAMQDRYKLLYGKTPEIKAIHAGLECGIIGGIYPKMDMISFGPTICYPHSPDEKV